MLPHSITMRSIAKQYGRVVALNGIDLDIGEGEFFTLLGPSGSGKTTILMLIAGFIRADYGSIRFGDSEVIRLPAHERNVGVVFQNYALFPHLSVADNIGYPLWVRGISKSDRKAKIADALGLVKLSGFGDRQISQLSGGQKQRVALARAVVFSPRILLMDEPLSALDKNLREEMQVEIRNLQRRLGVTTVFVTHDQREALTMSDRVAVMDKGSLVQIGPPREVYDAPRNRFVADFIGDANILPIDTNGNEVKLADVALRVTTVPGATKAGKKYLVLRPERLILLRSADSLCANVVPAVVRDILFQGETQTVQLELSTGELLRVREPTATIASNSALQPRQDVYVGFQQADALVVRDE